MAEAELSADLLASLTDGIQTNKTIEQLYKKYEDNSGQIDQAVDNFNKIMSYIGEIYPPEQIKSTNWSRVQLFYTLFTTIGHLLFKLDGPSQQYNIGVEPKDIGKLRVRLDEVSTRYDDYTNDPENPGIPSDYRMFIDRSRRATTDTNVRIERTNFLCEKLVEVLAQ